MAIPVEQTSMEAINEIFSEMVNEVGNEDVNDESSSSKGSEPSDDTGNSVDEDDSELDFGDMPNGEIRYIKLKDQNKELKAQINEIKNDLAKLKTQRPSEDQNDEDQDDPTEYMSQNEKLLYEQQQKLTKELNNVTSKLQKFEKKETDDINGKREKSFVKNHPEFGKSDTDQDVAKAVLKAQEFFLDYFDGRPDLAPIIPLLKNGTLSLEQVYAAALAETGAKPQKTAQVQESGRVFGNGKKRPTSARIKSDVDSEVEDAYSRLADPDNDDKEADVNIAVGDLVNDIARLVEEQS